MGAPATCLDCKAPIDRGRNGLRLRCPPCAFKAKTRCWRAYRARAVADGLCIAGCGFPATRGQRCERHAEAHAKAQQARIGRELEQAVREGQRARERDRVRP